jgi:hypothetical protein
MAIELPDGLLDAVAEQLAPRIAERLVDQLVTPEPEWLTFDELVQFTRLPAGNLRKLVANGEIPKHGGKTHVFYREEINTWLLGYSRRQRNSGLRSVG